jgi:hypothetical protein
MAEKQWCPGCSREVEGVCYHFNCAIGPNGLDAQSRSSAGTVEAALRWIYENDRIECFDCDPPHGAEIIHVGHQKTIARGPSAMKAKEALAMLSPAQSSRERALEAAALDFIAKVERGEARSTKSYSAFKAALDTGLPTADDVRGILAAQPPVDPVEMDTDDIDWDTLAEERLGQRPPRSSAATEHAKVADWLEDQARIATNGLHCGDNSAMIQQTHDWANKLEAAARHLRAVPQTAASPEISRLIAKSDEQTTALDQIMTTAADNLAAANSDLKMTLEFIHHVAEYTLAVTRPHQRGGE